jgi:hypothetical protein
MEAGDGGGGGGGEYRLLRFSLCHQYFLSSLRARPSMSPVARTSTTICNSIRSARIKTLVVLL